MSSSFPPCQSTITPRYRKRYRKRPRSPTNKKKMKNVVDLQVVRWRPRKSSPSSQVRVAVTSSSSRYGYVLFLLLCFIFIGTTRGDTPTGTSPHVTPHPNKELTTTTTTTPGKRQTRTRLDQPTYASFSAQKPDTSTNLPKRQRQRQVSSTEQPQNVIQLMETEYYDGQTWKPHSSQTSSSSLLSSSRKQSASSSSFSSTTTTTPQWTTPDGHPSVNPTHVKPPSGTQFVDTWKIVTGDRRDNMGWEYFWNTQSGVRRRTWLRTIQPLQQQTHHPLPTSKTIKTTTTEGSRTRRRSMFSFRQQRSPTKLPTTQPLQQQLATTTITTTRQPQRRLLPWSLSSLWKSIQEDWNFKGFGMTVFKSLLDPTSCGIAVRIPLSPNFDWCDRHPAFPAISVSWGIYYPFMTGIFLSSSIHVQWLQYVVERVCQKLQCVCKFLYMIVFTLSTFPLAAIFPLYRTYQTNQWNSIFRPPPIPSPQYSLEILERVGVSYSWRYSFHKGYEVRTGYWHWWAPTIVYLHSLGEVIRNTIGTTLVSKWSNHPQTTTTTTTPQGRRRRSPTEEESTTRSSSHRTTTTTTTTTTSPSEEPSSSSSSPPSTLIHWMRQKFGSVGLSSSIPLPDPPYFSSSACLSLSGFYFQRSPPPRSPRSSSSSTATTTTRTETSRIDDDQISSVLSNMTRTTPEKERVSLSSSTTATNTTTTTTGSFSSPTPSTIQKQPHKKGRISKDELEINRALQDTKKTNHTSSTRFQQKPKTQTQTQTQTQQLTNDKEKDNNDEDQEENDTTRNVLQM